MRAVMLPDRDFLARERRLLDRLEVGLADEGYRLFHALPASAVEGGVDARTDELPGVYSTSLTYADTGLPFTQSLRVAALAGSLQTLIEGEPAPVGSSAGIAVALPASAVGQRVVDVVHAFGMGSWAFASGLSKRMGARLVLEVFDAAMVMPAARLFASASPQDGHALCLAVDQPLLSALRAAMPRNAPPSAVALARWGVHVPAQARDWSKAFGASGAPTGRAAVLLASGVDKPGIRAAIEGLAHAARVLPDLLVFVDSTLCERTPVWAWSQQLGLGDRLSVLPKVEGSRDLVLQADLLVLPEAAGLQRTLALDAMASGMLVVARPDPMVSWLIDGETASLVGGSSGADAAAWSSAITGLLGAPEHAGALAASARQYIGRHCLMSGYLRDVLTAYAA